ncbi:transposase [Streptomyces sp. BK79]|uniref:transposase n=1 Tax=Streptomyces sp. BK79 TaxID=3350097 RepID=UPI00377070E6
MTDTIADELATWQRRPLGAIWPIIYIDALWSRMRHGSVVSKPVYLAVGVDGRPQGRPGPVGRRRGEDEGLVHTDGYAHADQVENDNPDDSSSFGS